ncbi:hypothetical protein [Bacillus nitroreducens]
MNIIFLWFLTTFAAVGVGYILGSKIEGEKVNDAKLLNEMKKQ